MSKPMTVSIPHQLSRAEARRRVEEGFGKLTGQLGGGAGAVTQSWHGDTMKFAAKVMGQSISGHLDVLDDAVKMEVLLPAFLAMMAGKIQGRVEQEGHKMLEQRTA
jgi:putative polyhydroxyalkanoate system protein